MEFTDDDGLHVAAFAVTMSPAPTSARDFSLLGGSAYAVWGVAVGAALSVAGCASEPDLGVAQSAITTVSDFGSSGCSTAVVIGLSNQIAQEAGCENPTSFVSFAGTPGVTLTSNAVLPFLVKDARDDLQKVAANNSLQINSALRSIAQQYLLYHWYLQGRCGITAAATVGHSNHEGGRAVDLANYSSRISAMSAHGWAHDVPGDVVHFDHTSSVDNRGQDTKAFQVLWNKNNPNDKIAEDGAYGPQTEARLKASPATGFAIGPSCTTQHVSIASAVSITGPDQMPPQTSAHYTIVVQNAGTTDWTPTTQIVASSNMLHDASWISATEITTLGSTVAVGDQGTIDLDIMTPAVDVATPITQQLAFIDDNGATLGTIDLSVTVAPNANPDTSGDGTEPDPTGGTTGSDGMPDTGSAPTPGDLSSGCSTGQGVGWLALVLPALVLRRRRS